MDSSEDGTFDDSAAVREGWGRMWRSLHEGSNVELGCTGRPIGQTHWRDSCVAGHVDMKEECKSFGWWQAAVVDAD